MNRKLFFLLCVPLLLTGCFREKYGTTHYCFGNKTNKVVHVVSYSHLDSSGKPVDIEHSFGLAPGEEYEIKDTAMGGFPGPFNRRYVRISDGEREVTFVSRPDQADQKTYLYDVESYRLVKSKKYERWYRYDFTDRDFEDGIPVTEETEIDY